MDIPESVRELLQEARGDALCNACLAFACSTSLTEMWQATAALLGERAEVASAVGTCDRCHRMTSTFTWVGQPKCAHCSRPLGDASATVSAGGDEFHRHCWRVLVADDRGRISRSLSRESRELIARARLHLDRVRADRSRSD